jgi:hypothetical protein
VSGPGRPHTREVIARKTSRKSILIDVQSWQKLENFLRKRGNLQMKYRI